MSLSIRYGGYRRDQIDTLANGWPIMRSYTPTLGEFFWIGVTCADKDLHPFGGRTFDTLAELREFADYRGF